jgi:hypothetical protein
MGYHLARARSRFSPCHVESVGEAVVSAVDVAVYEAVGEAPGAEAAAPGSMGTDSNGSGARIPAIDAQIGSQFRRIHLQIQMPIEW